MNKAILKSTWALGNATLLATMAYNCSKLQQGYWIFLLSGLLYFELFIINQAHIILTGQKRTAAIQYKLIFLAGISDFLANYCLTKAFASGMSYYLVIFLSQLTFLVVIGIKNLILKERGDLSPMKMLVFSILIGFSFLVNYSGDSLPFKWSIGSIFLVLMSNLLFATSIILQPMISKNGISFCMRDISLVAFIFGAIISAFFDYKDIGKQCLDFYKKSHMNVIFYALSGALFYVITPPFIRQFGGVSFNASTLPFSVITGIFSEIAGKNVSIIMICGSLVSIISSQILVIMEK
ncbi:hypothetical protein DMUE_3963 [Dictyocoela muelleri]|nr:hypothetical protein DMUE_3963 [Dictyocoela muelleri]